MRSWLILGGCAAIGGAFGVALVEAFLSHNLPRATALAAGGLISIPLAAAIKI